MCRRIAANNYLFDVRCYLDFRKYLSYHMEDEQFVMTYHKTELFRAPIRFIIQGDDQKSLK